MNQLVLLQFCGIFETFGAEAAGVRSLLRVADHVYFQVPSPGTGLPALVTFKWFLPRMDPLVLLQSALPPKLLPAELTTVQLLSRVNEQMLPERVHQVEAFLALLAGVAPLSWNLLRCTFTFTIFPAVFVDSCVQLQLPFSLKR